MNDKYLHFDLDDFAVDEAFISWVREGDHAADWEKWIDDHDKSEVCSQARNLINALSIQKMDVDTHQADRIWNNIQRETKPETVVTSRVVLWRRAMAIAAAFLVGGILLNIFMSSDAIKTGQGEHMAIVLPDGSKVTLNAKSSVSYDEKDFLNSRDIYLEGEGFFEVQKGSPFTVHASNGSVKVLGTSFNVNTRAKVLDVTCKTGSVAVQNKTKDKEVVLSPGEGIRYFDNVAMGKYDAKVDYIADWIQHKYHFESKALSVVFDELKTQYGLNISADQDVQNMLFTGSFIGMNQDSALHQVCWPMNLEYTISGKNIQIKRK